MVWFYPHAEQLHYAASPLLLLQASFHTALFTLHTSTASACGSYTLACCCYNSSSPSTLTT